MAGIVKMLHALHEPSDKYSYHAHRKRIRVSQPRNQKRTLPRQAFTVPGPFSAYYGLCPHHKDCGVCTCSIWLILINLLVVLVPSIKA